MAVTDPAGWLDPLLALYAGTYGPSKMPDAVRRLWKKKLFGLDIRYGTYAFEELLGEKEHAFKFGAVLAREKELRLKAGTAQGLRDKDMPNPMPQPEWVDTVMTAEKDFKSRLIDHATMCRIIQEAIPNHVWNGPWDKGSQKTLGDVWRERFDQLESNAENGVYEAKKFSLEPPVSRALDCRGPMNILTYEEAYGRPAVDDSGVTSTPESRPKKKANTEAPVASDDIDPEFY